MPKYTIHYALRLWGCVEIDAPSEEDANDDFCGLSYAELVESADLCGGDDVEVIEIETDASPLEQLAEQAE